MSVVVVNLDDAWKLIGFDPARISSTIMSKPVSERVKVAFQLLEVAKKRSRNLLAENHPDRGGSREKFLAISSALQKIEESTVDFEKKMKENEAIRNQANAKRVTLVIG